MPLVVPSPNRRNCQRVRRQDRRVCPIRTEMVFNLLNYFLLLMVDIILSAYASHQRLAPSSWPVLLSAVLARATLPMSATTITHQTQQQSPRFQQLVEICVDDLPCRALVWMPEAAALSGAIVISVMGYEWVVHKAAIRRNRVHVDRRSATAA